MYYIGLDFGTLSVRGILFDASPNDNDGKNDKRDRTLRSCTVAYETVDFEDGSCLFRDADEWARAGERVLQELMAASTTSSSGNVSPIAGIGIAFTSCTIVPITEQGEPIATKFREVSDPQQRPHIFPKMWRHHSPHVNRVAEELTKAVHAQGETWLDDHFGGKLGLEWLHAKALEVYDLDLEAFESTYAFVEAGDYVVWALCGRRLPLKEHFKRSTQQAAFKACCVSGRQLITSQTLRLVRPGIQPADIDRINSESKFDFVSPGTCVGKLGTTDIPIAVATIDAHAGAFGLGAFRKGRFVMVVGTSACFMLSSVVSPSSRFQSVKGAAGSIPDGIAQGLQGFEFGQAAAGDACAWLSRFTGIPLPQLDAHALGLLCRLASKGTELECWAVDHLNGCRSPLMDGDARGSLRNLSLSTTPAHAFLALIEALCFGIRVVIDMVRRHQVEIQDFVLAGGLAKSELFRIVLATVLNEPIIVYEDGGDATSRGAAAYATLMTTTSPSTSKSTTTSKSTSMTTSQSSTSMATSQGGQDSVLARFIPRTFIRVLPSAEQRKVIGDDRRFARYVEAANVKSFLLQRFYCHRQGSGVRVLR